MPKWVYPLAFLFVLFLIYNEPTSAGETASNFASFVVQLLGSVGEFLTGLFEGASDGSTNVSSGTPSSDVEGSVDTFTHTHDGLAPHSHSTAGN